MSTTEGAIRLTTNLRSATRRSHDRRTVPGHKAIPAATAIPNMANRNSEVIVQAMVRLLFTQGREGTTVGAARQCGR
jgi:hypothetical protein